MSVCLSLCGGAGVGVEGCGMHQNMCLLAALMLRRSRGRLALSLPAVQDLSPRLPSFGLQPPSLQPQTDHHPPGGASICAVHGQSP